MPTTTAPKPPARLTLAARRRYIKETTIEVKIYSEPFSYLRMEAKIGPKSLLHAVARAIQWGERRHGGAIVVRLPIDDVEVILDGLVTLADRMEADPVGDNPSRGRVLRERYAQMCTRLQEQSWIVIAPQSDGQPNGHRLVKAD